MPAAAMPSPRPTRKCSAPVATWRHWRVSSPRPKAAPGSSRSRSSSRRRRSAPTRRLCSSTPAAGTSTSSPGKPLWRVDMKMLLALAALLQTVTPSTGPNPAEFPQQKRLAENVYVWSDVHPSGLYTTNNLIVITTDGVLVADGQRDAAATKKMIDGIGALTRQPIKVVVIGSEHGDHTGGNASFPSSVTFIKSPLPNGKQTTLKMGGTEIQVLDRGRAHTGTDLVVYLPKEKILFASEAYSNHIFPNMRAAVP